MLLTESAGHGDGFRTALENTREQRCLVDMPLGKGSLFLYLCLLFCLVVFGCLPELCPVKWRSC